VLRSATSMAAQWEREHFTLQAVDQYPAYVSTRQQCTDWSAPVSLANHTLTSMRARYPFEMTEEALRAHSPRFFAGCNPTWNTMVRTCVHPSPEHGDGVDHTWTYTRVGPMPLGPDAFVCLALIPAMVPPTLGTTTGTTFVTASSDSYVADAHDGNGFEEKGYPPIHPHHSNAFMVGYHPALTQQGGPNSGSPFEGFYPWPAYSTHQLDHFGAQASMNSPGFNADFVGCRPGVALAACSYLEMPPGHGFPIYKGTDMWSTTLINRVGDWRERPGQPFMHVMFEYGRRFATARGGPGVKRPSSILRPMWTLDFAVVGNGNTYELGRFAKLEAAMFHTYVRRVARTLVSNLSSTAQPHRCARRLTCLRSNDCEYATRMLPLLHACVRVPPDRLCPPVGG
jgi:hypothetical protein